MLWVDNIGLQGFAILFWSYHWVYFRLYKMKMEMVDEDGFPTIKPNLYELSKRIYESLVAWFYL
jgi:hypothetical protein